MQTKVRTFQRGDQTVELHAQLRFGDQEHYDYWNCKEFNDQFDNVLFELLIDEDLLEYTSDSGLCKPKSWHHQMISHWQHNMVGRVRQVHWITQILNGSMQTCQDRNS
jgi:hypothetical protein